MKVLILAGGLGTRLQEETVLKPKPMVEIGGRPMIWHIMNVYAAFGYKEFVVALGYKGEMIKRYFLDYYHNNQSITANLATGTVSVHPGAIEDWTVHLVDTGDATETGGRIRRAAPFLGGETFMMTYGDGVSNINVRELIAFHRKQGGLATVTAVRFPARFGGLNLAGDRVREFVEKPQIGEGWISGGFFVLEPGVLDYIPGDDSIFERDPLERISDAGKLFAYRHEDFWQCMDTLRDVRRLESLWQSGEAPWKRPLGSGLS
jgi:glucose-1-phosphate cytidylyltransferase